MALFFFGGWWTDLSALSAPLLYLSLKRMRFRYQPYYCEENIWWLCQEPQFAACRRRVVVISNAAKRCALWQQRSAEPGAIVLWDYHVVLLIEDRVWQIWDLDSRLALPVRADHYLTETFRPLEPELSELAPQFRVLEVSDWLETLTTDRSHMRGLDGDWLQPPPVWPPPTAPGHEMNLPRFIDMSDREIPGDVYDLKGMAEEVAPLLNEANQLW